MTNTGKIAKSAAYMLIFVLILTGLVLVAGCTQKSPEPGVVQNNSSGVMNNSSVVQSNSSIVKTDAGSV